MGRLWRARGLLCLGKRRRPKDHGATAVGGTDPPTGEVERAATPAQRHSALEPGTRGCEPSAATSLPLQGGGGQTAREDGRNHGVRCPTPAEVARPPRPDAASCPSDREGGEGPGSYGQPPPRGGGVGQGFPLESHEDPEEYYDALSDASWFIEGEGCSIERDLQRTAEERCRCRAAYLGDVQELVELVNAHEDLLVQRDTHGNTALHVAVMCRNSSAVEALLLAGAKVEEENDRGWTALQDALSMGSREIAKLLYQQRVLDIKAAYQAKKEALLGTMRSMADCRFQMSWELGSNLFGYLLRQYAPSDTYTIYKYGNRIRVDGSLMGLDDEAKTYMPEWKRSHFSIVLLNPGDHGTDGGKSKIILINRETRQWVDLSKHKKKNRGDAVDLEVSIMMKGGGAKTKIKTEELHFKPLRTWTGAVHKEKVHGWSTVVYEAQARLVAVTAHKTPPTLPLPETFDGYLSMELPADRIKEQPVDPLSMSSLTKAKEPGGRSASGHDGGSGKKKPARKVTGRLWMAEDFPISLCELLPILEVIGYTNKHLKKVAGFIRKYGGQNLFPVKVQVPLLMTVFALVSFRDFKRMEKGDGEATDPSFYQLPQGFSETTVQAMFGFQGQGKRAKKQPGLGDSAADLVPGGDEIGVRDIEASGEDPWLAEWQDEQDF